MSVEIGGEKRLLRLPMGEMVSLEENAGISILQLAERIAGSDIRAADVAGIYFHGLRGAGSKPKMDLVYVWLSEKPLLEWIEPAAELLMMALGGNEGNAEAPAGSA